MPEVVVYAVQGRTHEQKKMLMQKITQADQVSPGEESLSFPGLYRET